MTEATPEPDLQSLLVQLANIPLFAVFMRPTNQFQSPMTPDGQAMLARHLAFLFDLQASGLLLAAGPLDLNVDSIEGMCILSASSREHAESIAADEPYGKAGWRTNTVQTWQLNEGLLVPAARAAADSAPTQ